MKAHRSSAQSHEAQCQPEVLPHVRSLGREFRDYICLSSLDKVTASFENTAVSFVSVVFYK
jgi:hypothetical protein